MSADLLREAAALMRERAEAATPSPWVNTGRHEDRKLGMSVSIAGNLKPAAKKVNGAKGTADFIASAYGWGPTESNAEHVASWHPAVALAVADWLDGVALFIEAREHAEYFDLDGDLIAPEDTAAIGYALAVARAYLGSAS